MRFGLERLFRRREPIQVSHTYLERRQRNYGIPVTAPLEGPDLRPQPTWHTKRNSRGEPVFDEHGNPQQEWSVDTSE